MGSGKWNELMREKELQKQVIELLSKSGAWFYHPREPKKGSDGIPDIVGCLNGKFFAIELKSPEFKNPENHLRPEQRKVLEKIKNAGGFTLVSNKLEEVVNFINLIRRL
jgi:Holliday junction resolvase